MKPSWNDAPEWANWLAMDIERDWYWYEEKPVYDEYTGWWKTDKRQLSIESIPARDTLEERPK